MILLACVCAVSNNLYLRSHASLQKEVAAMNWLHLKSLKNISVEIRNPYPLSYLVNISLFSTEVHTKSNASAKNSGTLSAHHRN